MNKFQNVKVFALVLVSCVGLSIPASATQTVSQFHTEPIINGSMEHPQETWSSLYVDENSSAWGGAWLRSKTGDTFPAGSLGVEARLYNEDGELCASTGMRYNASPASFVGAVTTASPEGYCSWVHTRSTRLEGEGLRVLSHQGLRVTADDDFVYLHEINNFKFPEKLLTVLKKNEDGYPANNRGETYGSALLAGYNDNYMMSPTLLSAVGTGGVHGYVREADLNPYAATTQDAVAYMSKLEKNRVLPLYDKEGKVIGTFVLDGSFISGTTDKELETAKASAAAKPGTKTRQSVKLPKTEAEFTALVKRSEANCPYQRTSKGETYGSFTMFGSVGYEPVWITVISTDDGPGLVRAKDLYRAEPGVLPVYDLEGNVVGEYLIEEPEPLAGYKPGMSIEEARALMKER